MHEPEHQIGFEQLGLGSVLFRHSLRVPLNQREYSWTDRQVTDLFQDIAEAIANNSTEYFLGTVVAIPRQLGVLEIVDGQQRLASTAILLAAIRNYLRESPPDALIVERIENNFLSVIDPHARARVSRLRLNVLDSDYFGSRIIAADTSVIPRVSSHRLIDSAAELARKHVRKVVAPYDPNTHGDILNRWVEFIEHRAIVILLKVPSGANAYRMFETLNDRGLRTSQSDLVKNYLFEEVGERTEEAQQRWSSMKAVLESIDDDDEITITFLRQILISLYGHLRKEKLYETVQSKAKGSTQAFGFLSTLDVGAVDFAAIMNPAHSKWNLYPPTTRRAVETLALLRITPARPLILAVVRVFDARNTDLSLRLLVNLAVRFLIVGGARSGTVEEGLAGIAKEVSEGRVSDARGLLTSLESIAPSDTEFEQEFATATVSKEPLARYYLRSLELSVKGDPNPCFIPNDDQTVITLEHILPKNMEGNWPIFSQEEADALYKRIGNMVLLQAKPNSDLKSSEFSEKRIVYEGSPYELTRQVAEIQGDWTADEINKRQRVLAKIAVTTWPLSST